MVQALDQVWVGLAEIGLGLVFCFVGQSAARVVLAVWGALVGFVGGSMLYVVLPRVAGDALAAVPWWVYAIGLGLLVAWLAFAFYAVGVLISMGALGYLIGTTVAVAFAMSPWLTLVSGLVVAAGLVMIGLTINLPRLLLIVITALVGAGAVLDGVQLLMGRRLDWFSQMGWRTDLPTHAAWSLGFVLLAGGGMFLQFRQRGDETLRDAYRRA